MIHLGWFVLAHENPWLNLEIFVSWLLNTGLEATMMKEFTPEKLANPTNPNIVSHREPVN
jgi:hypothetical protein